MIDKEKLQERLHALQKRAITEVLGLESTRKDGQKAFDNFMKLTKLQPKETIEKGDAWFLEQMKSFSEEELLYLAASSQREELIDGMLDAVCVKWLV